MTLNETHPGTALGNWIRARRRELRLTPSLVADEIKVSPAAYAEVELGITDWIGDIQVESLAQVLLLDEASIAQIGHLVSESRKVPPVKFSDVFTREELTPVRLRTLDKTRAPREEEVNALLEAVFQPLQ